MLVYEGIKSGFINDVDLGIIADKIRNKYIEKIKKNQVHQNLIHGKTLCNI